MNLEEEKSKWYSFVFIHRYLFPSFIARNISNLSRSPKYSKIPLKKYQTTTLNISFFRGQLNKEKMSHLGICNHQIDEVNCNEVIKQGWLGSSKDYNFQAIYWLLYVTWYKITAQVSSKNPQLPTSFPGHLPWLLGRLPPLPALRYCFV